VCRHPATNIRSFVKERSDDHDEGTTMKMTTVQQSFVGLLYEDGVFKQVLQPGRHRLRRNLFDKTTREVRFVDMRERTLTIKGQEILTSDKVAVRVSLLVYFRVRDPKAACHNVASYEERIYEDVQLAARRFLASRDLEAILNDRNEISDAVREVVTDAAAGYGVEIRRAEVKDLAFPGNLREIMNQVLETERRAEARLIQARKEAEALSIKTTSEVDAERERIAVQREQALARAQSEHEGRELRLEAALKEAEALKDNPELLRLRELEALTEMARGGAKFVSGINVQRLVGLLGDQG
jgi:regulator of protease activity HflC (stomatin/prohibitin superfamily)